MNSIRLHEHQRLPTSGARAMEVLEQDGHLFLAVPQLAVDLPGRAPSMMAGDHSAATLLYRWDGGRFLPFQSLDTPGGEDAEAFCIGSRRFLATASLRTGADPYDMAVTSTIHEWANGGFVPLQHVPTFAAKQWKHFSWQGRHFLALAQGISLMPPPPGRGARSCIFEWDGQGFRWLQDVPSEWGYNWHFMVVDGVPLLAHADHVSPSVLLRWNGSRFETAHVFEQGTGRAFCHFNAHGQTWLAMASLYRDTWLHRWTGVRFEPVKRLSGPGGRELAWTELGGGHLVQVNFIHGTREAPQPDLESVIYGWEGKDLVPKIGFPTSGGTDAAWFEADGVPYLGVSNSLAANQSFRTDSIVYRVELR